jgi:hypothetical protein
MGAKEVGCEDMWPGLILLKVKIGGGLLMNLVMNLRI